MFIRNLLYAKSYYLLKYNQMMYSDNKTKMISISGLKCYSPAQGTPFFSLPPSSPHHIYAQRLLHLRQTTPDQWQYVTDKSIKICLLYISRGFSFSLNRCTNKNSVIVSSASVTTASQYASFNLAWVMFGCTLGFKLMSQMSYSLSKWSNHHNIIMRWRLPCRRSS